MEVDKIVIYESIGAHVDYLMKMPENEGNIEIRSLDIMVYSITKKEYGVTLNLNFINNGKMTSVYKKYKITDIESINKKDGIYIPMNVKYDCYGVYTLVTKEILRERLMIGIKDIVDRYEREKEYRKLSMSSGYNNYSIESMQRYERHSIHGCFLNTVIVDKVAKHISGKEIMDRVECSYKSFDYYVFMSIYEIIKSNKVCKINMGSSDLIMKLSKVW